MRPKHIELSDLKNLREFVLVPDFLSLTGSVVYGEGEPDDLDCVVRCRLDEEGNLVVDLHNLLSPKLERALGEVSDRPVHVIPSSPGPNWSYVPLADLVVRPKDRFEVIEVDEPAFDKKASEELMREAERTLEEGSIEPMRFVHLLKPIRPVGPNERMTEGNFIEYMSGRLEDGDSFVVEKKYDGVHVLIMQSAGRAKIITDDAEDATSRLPSVVEAVKGLGRRSLTLDAELELWEDGQHQPREEVAGYLHSHGEADDSGIVVNIFGLLLDNGEDLHKLTELERLGRLEKLGIEHSTISEPGGEVVLNRAPYRLAESKSELERAFDRFVEAPASEGLVAKQADAPYLLSGGSEEIWVKYHLNALLAGQVIERHETKVEGVYNYSYGLLPGDYDPAEPVESNGRTLIPIGKTFSTDEKCEKGDIIEVEFETFNFYEKKSGVEASAWVPRFIGKSERLEPDTLSEVMERAERNRILVLKEVAEKAVVDFPSDEDKSYRWVVQTHWRGQSAHLDFRYEVDGVLEGWTLLAQKDEAVDEPVTTLQRAKQVDGDADNWKWDIAKGEPKERRTRGGDVRPANLQAVRKKTEPHEWLEVEGVTEPGAVGATEQYPGVFHIVAKGEIEFGANKAYFYEYFLDGNWKGRLLFRMLKASSKVLPPGEEQEHRREEFYWIAMRPEDQTPYVISDDAVEKGWYPDGNRSALPEEVRKALPEEARFWTKSGDARTEARQRAVDWYKEHRAGKQRKDNAPTTVYRVVYGEDPPGGSLSGRTNAGHKLWEGLQVDEHLKEEWLRALNSIDGVEVRSSCEGHGKERPAYIILRFEDECYDGLADKLAEKLNGEGYRSEAVEGNQGRPRIIVAGRTWYGKSDWSAFWENLADRIERGTATLFTNKLDLSEFRAEGVDADLLKPRERWRELLADLRYLGNSAYPKLKAGEEWGRWSLEDVKKYFAAVVDKLRSIWFPLVPPEKGDPDYDTSYWELYREAQPLMESEPPSEEELREWEDRRSEFVKAEKGIRPPWGSRGGKRKLAGKIVDMIPEHKIYVEPFFGGGAVFWRKEPSEKEVVGDINKEITRTLKFLRDMSEAQRKRFKELNWSGSRANFNRAWRSRNSGSKTKAAWSWILRNRFSYACDAGDDDNKPVYNPRAANENPWGGRNHLDKFQERLKDVVIVNGDWKKLVQKYDGTDTFFYLDPPYPGTRTTSIGDVSREEILKVCKGIKGKFLLSIDDCKENRQTFSSFNIHSTTIRTNINREWGKQGELLIANYGGSKAEESEFVLQRRWWRGQVVVRLGPSTELWDLKIKENGGFEHWVLAGDPRKGETAAYREDEVDSFRYPEDPAELKPGTPANPTKATDAYSEEIDHGKVTVLEDSAGVKKLRLEGGKLEGLYVLSQEEPGSDIWTFRPSEEAPAAKFHMEFTAKDAEERTVSGIVYPTEKVDSDGEYAAYDTVREGMFFFMERGQGFNDSHTSKVVDATVLESFQAEQKTVKDDKEVPEGAWWMRVRINDGEIWNRVKSGELRGFSWEGWKTLED